MAGRLGVDWRAIYVPPMALYACNTRTTVTSETGERSREPHGQEDDPTSRTIHRSRCLVGIPGSWVGWDSYLARAFNHGATLLGINRGPQAAPGRTSSPKARSAIKLLSRYHRY